MEAAKTCLKNGKPSVKWFQRFYKRHASVLSEKLKHKQDKKRVQAATEEAVDEHFYGKYGLRAELIAAQAANPEAPLYDEATNTILDPRRILNEDELPQFIDYADNKGNNKKKVGAGKGDIAQEAAHPNRTCVTVHMVWSLDGFKWGDQVIFAQSRLSDNMAIEEARHIFTNQIHEAQHISTFLLVSPTEKGVQTGDTLGDRMDMLDKEVTARGLPRPLIILTDGHKSRFSHQVLSKCREYQFKMYVERSNSSQFLQALDQFNKKFHNQYIKAKKNYKKEKVVQLTRESGKPHSSGDIKLSKIDFLIIFSRISLDWCTAEDRRTSFRVVGILQNALAPSEIDRKAFIVQPESPKATSVVTFGPVASPEDVRKNSTGYWKAKFLACDERRVALENLHARPKEIGLLDVPMFTATGKRRKRNFTDKHGSLDMQQMLELREEADSIEEAAREQRIENDHSLARLDPQDMVLDPLVLDPRVLDDPLVLDPLVLDPLVLGPLVHVVLEHLVLDHPLELERLPKFPLIVPQSLTPMHPLKTIVDLVSVSLAHMALYISFMHKANVCTHHHYEL
ncbi:hypothetical protein CYMTET_14622 [Cymbomonas tetramitiformis]|uniref:Uncharacterized protein n=1 Tax=Cymbomonas tetramitiformis TaxID=36881 RepID=A0AAE0GG08_9CHLO|nr:hypothetical protein CYMTET_14622 [Cymbomonas tetramitiformis]